jgi:predicted TIM-barrel fold metal-dependent hydrolase
VLTVDLGVDCHCHVFDPARFPYSADAAYRPPPHEAGTAAQLAAVLDAHALSHAVLVNPTSGYGYDNDCMIAALRASSGRFKGVARVRPDVDARTLAALRDAGVVGVRLDLVTDGVSVLRDPAIPRLLGQIRELGWLLDIQPEGDQLCDALATLRAARVPLVVDHCGRPDATKGVVQPGFQALLELGREGHHVKLSAPFRFVKALAPGADPEPFVDALIAAFTPKRCVWGSDWPFLRMPMRMDYGPVLANLGRWLRNAGDRQQVFWGTPARLFGFESNTMRA